MSHGYELHRGVLSTCETALKESDVDVDAFIEEWPENKILEIPIEELPSSVVSDWYDSPELVQSHFARALAAFTDDDDLGGELHDAIIRITGFREADIRDVGQYRPDNVAERMIHIRGQVTEQSQRKLRDEQTAFECQRCGQLMKITQHGDELSEPHECKNCERQGPFRVDDKETVMRNYQTVRLQTLPEETDDGETETITVKVFDDLVGEMRPGDRVIANTIIRAKREKDTRVRILEGHVESVHKLTADHSDIDIDPYRGDIMDVVTAENTYEQVIDSIAPFHHGDRQVKEAIALQLFGGIEKELPDGGWMRGNSHVLLMGDPGSGKTAIIRYAATLVPRSEFATGKRSSEAGLTAGAVKDDLGDGWMLQAGTLVRANNGLAVIDELDKMDREDRDGIIDAMSEQQITVNKIVSGVLPAKTSILSAANPKYGTFDPMTDIGKQLDLDEVLLSRFDLWFLMRDEPEREKDEAVATSMTTEARIGQKVAKGEDLTTEDLEDTSATIPPDMFRAYVAWAKQHFPVFTSDAEKRIISEYVELRQVNEDDDGPVPTTARLVEALHRLSEASARIRLAEQIVVDDVERAIDIMYESLETLGVDPDTGDLDASVMETGSSSSRHDKRKALMAIISGNSTEDEPADYSDVKEEAMVIMDPDEFDHILEKLLREDGDVYEPSTGQLRLV